MSIEDPTKEDLTDNVVLLQAPQQSALPASRYLMSGAPTTCAACAKPFAGAADHLECWHGADGRYYCSPTCTLPPRRSGQRARGERRAA